MSAHINLSGDISFSHFDQDNIIFCEKVTSILEKSQFNICNLENPICDGDLNYKPKPIILKSRKLPGIILNNFDAFSLANNHILDCEEEGLKQTQIYLNKNNKKFFGAGFNKKIASEPLIVSLNNIPIVLWGITRFENAKSNKPGTASDNAKQYKKDIIKHKNKGYFIIFYTHWGREYVDYPTPDDRNLARTLIDYGADCVVGTHPHVPQGSEIYQGKYIFYSLGNFIFSDNISYKVAYNVHDNRLNLGYIVQLRIEDDLSYSPVIIPYFTKNGNIKALNEDKKEEFQKKFVTISLKTNDEEVYLKEFFSSVKDIRKQSKRMIKKQVSEHGLSSLIEPIKNLRLQDLRIILYPNLESKFKVLQKDNLLSRIYSVIIHKFLTFSVIGLIVTLTTMITLGVLLGVVMLPLFPTWWIVYLSAIGLSLFLNNKLIFKDKLTIAKGLKFFVVYLISMFLGIYLLKLFRLITDLPNWLLGYLVLPFTLTYNFLLVNKVLQKKTVKGITTEDKLNKLFISPIS